jgi:hypothetical protein
MHDIAVVRAVNAVFTLIPFTYRLIPLNPAYSDTKAANVGPNESAKASNASSDKHAARPSGFAAKIASFRSVTMKNAMLGRSPLINMETTVTRLFARTMAA